MKCHLQDERRVFRDLVTQSIGAGPGEPQAGFGTGRPANSRAITTIDQLSEETINLQR